MKEQKELEQRGRKAQRSIMPVLATDMSEQPGGAQEGVCGSQVGLDVLSAIRRLLLTLHVLPESCS